MQFNVLKKERIGWWQKSRGATVAFGNLSPTGFITVAVVLFLLVESTAHAISWRTLFGGADFSAVPADGAALSSAPLSAIGAPRGTLLGFQEGTAVGFSLPSSAAISARSGLTRYRVKRGDTPAKIAARFDITLETLERANPKMSVPLRVGAELVILPVSGALYEIAAGDSIESVTARYKISPETFMRYNPGYERLFTAGKGTLIVPFAVERE